MNEVHPISRRQSFVLIIIVWAQFCGTSLWFAGNAALPILQHNYTWPSTTLGYLTGAVQLGFISGTLCLAILGIPDRFQPSKIFFFSCFAGACFNALGIVYPKFIFILITRFLVGVSLAGIYPIGMKVAADWNETGLGYWLGALVGALVLGTAFPHALRSITLFVDVKILLIGISSLAVLGGLCLLLFVPAGPYRKASMQFSFISAFRMFQDKSFRTAALGYFGHMWELYAFWAFVPWAIEFYKLSHPTLTSHSALLAFIIIASGAVGCWTGGYLSGRIGSERIALYALTSSFICCLLSPLLWSIPPFAFLSIMIIWGITVVADSPQFSALVARHAIPQLRGSAITLVTCIGFAITIVTIQLLDFLKEVLQGNLFLILAAGPLVSIFAMQSFFVKEKKN